MVLVGLYSFSNAIEEKFGKCVKQLLMIITASQFHFMFYMSRPLPNTFALSFGKSLSVLDKDLDQWVFHPLLSILMGILLHI